MAIPILVGWLHHSPPLPLTGWRYVDDGKSSKKEEEEKRRRRERTEEEMRRMGDTQNVQIVKVAHEVRTDTQPASQAWLRRLAGLAHHFFFPLRPKIFNL